MPAKKKIDYPELFKGLTWYIQWYTLKGGERKRIRRSKWGGVELNSIPDLKEREEVAKEMLHQLRLKLCPKELEPSNELFLDALDLALAIKRSLRWRTNKGYSENVRWLTEYFHKQGWQYLKCREVTFEHIQAYFDHMVMKRKIANSTYNSRKNNLRALATALVDRKYLKENLFSQIKDKPVGDPVRRPFTDDEKAVILQEIVKDHCLTLVFILLGYLAIRPGEIRDLRIQHIDLKKGVVRFPASQSKNNHNSYVTIPEGLIPRLKEYGFENYPQYFFVFGSGQGRHNQNLRPGPTQCGINTLSNKFRRMLKRLKRDGKLHDIKGLQLYSLKDTLALYLLDHMDIMSAMWHFRHNSLEVFKRYVKRLGQRNEKVSKLPVDFPV